MAAAARVTAAAGMVVVLVAQAKAVKTEMGMMMERQSEAVAQEAATGVVRIRVAATKCSRTRKARRQRRPPREEENQAATAAAARKGEQRELLE